MSCTTITPGAPIIGANITTPAFGVTPNYTIAPVNGTLTVGYIQENCFDSPLSASLPPKSEGIARGTSVAAVCVLRKATGLFAFAAGDLEVFDVGPNGSSAPQRVMARVDAFDYTLGAYRALIATGDLTRGRYYLVTSNWDDGSSSAGYFYILD